MAKDERKLDSIRRAVALRYDQQKDDVPRIVASGKGSIADRIIERAKEHGVEIYEDPDLVQMLSKLQVDQYIPGNLFVAVAEVMAYVYRMNHRVDEAMHKFQQAK